MEVLVHDQRPAHRRRPATGAGAPPSTSGVRAIAPLVVGLAPLALTVGATAARADLPALVGWASSAFLYGASGQLTWMDVLHGGGPAALAVSATVLVNLQMLLYGAAMRHVLGERIPRWRVGGGPAPGEPGVRRRHEATTGPSRTGRLRRRFYMAAGLTLWIAWLGLTGIGYAVGGLPSVPVLALVTPLVMLTLALRAVVDAATVAALIVAAARGGRRHRPAVRPRLRRGGHRRCAHGHRGRFPHPSAAWRPDAGVPGMTAWITLRRRQHPDARPQRGAIVAQQGCRRTRRSPTREQVRPAGPARCSGQPERGDPSCRNRLHPGAGGGRRCGTDRSAHSFHGRDDRRWHCGLPLGRGDGRLSLYVSPALAKLCPGLGELLGKPYAAARRVLSA